MLRLHTLMAFVFQITIKHWYTAPSYSNFWHTGYIVIRYRIFLCKKVKDAESRYWVLHRFIAIWTFIFFVFHELISTKNLHVKIVKIACNKKNNKVTKWIVTYKNPHKSWIWIISRLLIVLCCILMHKHSSLTSDVCITLMEIFSLVSFSVSGFTYTVYTVVLDGPPY